MYFGLISNCKGFEGPIDSVERSTNGFIPNVASDRELPIASLEFGLKRALEPYDVTFEELPNGLQLVVQAREAFAPVESVDQLHLHKGRIHAKDLVHKAIRHDQLNLAIQQVRIYAIHNGRMINDGKPVKLDPIEPYHGFKDPIVYDIPVELLDEKGDKQSMTLVGHVQEDV